MIKLGKSISNKIRDSIENPSFYWDRGSELSDDQMRLIFQYDDALNDISNEIYDWNLDHVLDLEYEAIENACKENWKKFPKKIQKEYDYDFDDFWEENKYELRDMFHDCVSVDLEIKELISRSSLRPVIKTGFTFCRKDFWDAEYQDFKDLLDLLEFNPYEFAIATDLNPISFPNILSRKSPKASLDYFVRMMKNTEEGELMILVNDSIDLFDFTTNWKDYHGKIEITNCSACFYEYCMGGYTAAFHINDLVLDYRFRKFNYEHCPDSDFNRGQDFTSIIKPKKYHHVSRNETIKKRIHSQRANAA